MASQCDSCGRVLTPIDAVISKYCRMCADAGARSAADGIELLTATAERTRDRHDVEGKQETIS
jgi:uncharacterized OB-fold protein